MEKIYSKTGDNGTTMLFGGERVDKDDLHIEAIGSIDELNAELGIIRTLLPKNHPWVSIVQNIQISLMTIMSHIATPNISRSQNPIALSEDLPHRIEEEIDKLSTSLPSLECGIIPGGTVLSAHLQFANTLARRSERRLWSLDKQTSQPEVMMVFFNRLSDLLYVMARLDMHLENVPEENWKNYVSKETK